MFLNILQIICPIYSIIFLGWRAGKQFGLKEKDLLIILFNIVMPTQVFFTLTQVGVEFYKSLEFILTFGSSCSIIFCIMFVISIKIFKNSILQAIINAQCSSHINIAFIALPIYKIFFGDITPVIYVIFYQMFVTIFILAILELNNKNRNSFKSILLQVLYSPIIISAILGVLFNVIGMELPEFLKETITIISNSSSFLALFVLGISFSSYRGKDMLRISYQSLIILILKNFLCSLLCYVISYYIFQVDSNMLIHIMAMSLMPTANNVYILSQKYKIQNESNQIVFISTFVSIILLSMYLYLFHS